MTGKIEIWTDGACSGNPGPGGWGALIRENGKTRELKGGEPATTNNKMELLAAISALESLPAGATADLYTDSQYVKGGIAGWIKNWKKNGWRTSDKSPVKNKELWLRLENAASAHKVEWHWLRGHVGHAENERADELAREGMAPFLKG
jgi:ribonuclease HI